MKLKSTQRKSLATVPSDYQGQERRFAQSVSESLDVLTGRRGDIIDRAVTFRDLLDTGVLKLVKGLGTGAASGGVSVTNPSTNPDGFPVQLPTQPENFVVSGGFDVIFLSWTLPPYNGHDYVEIYRLQRNSGAAVPTLAQAQAAGVYTRYYGDVYRFTDTNVGSQENWYYWIRAVNIDGVAGPFFSSTGANATTALDYMYVSGLIDDMLDDDVSNIGLNTTINALENNITTVQTNVAGLTSTVTTLNTTVAGNSASIQTNATSINGVEAKYSVKVDNNGHVSGFGLISTANNGTVTSSFVVASDRFAIAAPFNSNSTANSNVGTNYPFKVFTTATTVNGVSIPAGVYIDDAFIHDAQITNANIKEATITSAKIFDLSATRISTGNINIDNSNNIAIFQGKRTFSHYDSDIQKNVYVPNFNSTTSGFVLGNNNGNPVFHVGNASRYMKFDGATGDLTTTGLEVRDADGTVLLDSGGLRSSEGNNLLFNGSFVHGSNGWTSQGSVFFNTTQGRAYTDSGEYIVSHTLMPISINEPLYVYADVYGASAYATIVFYKADDSYASTTVSGTLWSPSAANSHKFRVAKVDYPSYSGNPYTHAIIRFGTLTGGNTTTWHQVGVSKTPPVIDPSYASTYIRDLSVDTLQIAGNAVTLADQTSTFPVGTGTSKVSTSLETGQMPENSAFVWFINAIVNQVSGNPSTYDLNIKIFTRTTSGSYVIHASRTIWIYAYGLDARIIKEEFPPSHNGDGFMKCEVSLYRHGTTTLVSSGAIEIAYVGAKK